MNGEAGHGSGSHGDNACRCADTGHDKQRECAPGRPPGDVRCPRAAWPAPVEARHPNQMKKTVGHTRPGPGMRSDAKDTRWPSSTAADLHGHNNGPAGPRRRAPMGNGGGGGGGAKKGAPACGPTGAEAPRPHPTPCAGGTVRRGSPCGRGTRNGHCNGARDPPAACGRVRRAWPEGRCPDAALPLRRERATHWTGPTGLWAG